jgi:hypothetical protein
MTRQVTAATMEKFSVKAWDGEAWRHYFKPTGIFKWNPRQRNMLRWIP